MVKNLNTVERGEKVRIGKVQPPTQAGNTIIVNASDTIVHAPHSGTFVSPIRYDDGSTTNVLAYNSTTKEIVTTQVVASDKNLQQVTDTGNETNTLVRLLGGAMFSNLTGLTGNVYIDDTGTTGNVIYARGNVYLEGNLTTIGEATFISSKNISITDPILELGQNNVNENLLYDVGVVMKRPGDNIAIAYREDVDELTFAYTANSASDRFITTTSNLLTMNVVGDVYANAYFGDGRTLTGIAHEVNLVDNSFRVSLLEANLVRVSNLETQMSSNAIRVGNLESNLAANSVRISTLESGLQQNADRITTLYAHHASNVIRIRNLESNLAANAVRVTNLEENLEDNSLRISTLSSRLADNSFRISVNTANIANLEVTSSNNFANIADLQVQLADNNVRITTLETYPARVVNLESNLAANSARITALEVLPAELLDNSARIAALELNPEFEGIITGDGGNISNLTLQYISDMGNTTSNTIVLTGSPTALRTTGFVGVNVEPEHELHVSGDTKVSGNIYATGTGTVIDGLNNKFTGNTSIYGNLNVHGATSYLFSENVYIKDPILGIGNNGVLDSGIIISCQNPSNVVFGYDGSATEFIVAHSTDSIDGATLTPDPTNDIDFHVYGDVQAKNITTTKDVVVGGNLTVSGNTTFLNVENLAVEDAIIKLAANNTTTGADTGVVMGRAEANVAVVYRGDENELMLAYTTSDPSGLDILPDASKHMNVHVYGSMFVDKTLNVNSNTFITEGGFIYANAFIGDGGLLSNVRTTLQSITDNGANTTHTVLFQNTTTGFEVTTGNALVAGNITVGDMVYVGSEPVAFQRDMDSNTARIVILESNLVANSARTSQLETDRDSNTARIVILESNLAANSLRTSQLETDMASNTVRIVILESNLAANSARTSQLETDMASNTARIVILESNLVANSARLSNLESFHEANVIRIGDLESTRATKTELATEVFTLNQSIASNLANAKVYTDIQVEANLITAKNYTDQVAALKSNVLDPVFTSNITVTSNVTTQTLAVGSLTPGRVVYVGANDFLVDSPNLTFTGTKLDVGGDMELTGNLTVGGTTTFLKTTNTIINDAIIELANNNTADTLDMGIIMTRPSSNVVVGYRGNEAELVLAHTLSDPSSTDIVPDTANALAVHVYGTLNVDGDVEVGTTNLYVQTTTGRVGVGTNAPSHSLDVRGTANVATVYADSNVGVKTTTPAYPLDVWGDANVAVLNATGLSVAPDADVTGVVGRLKVGDVTGTSDTAGVAHIDFASSTGYALYQDASGQTYVNGTNVRFNEGGAEQMRLTGGQLGIATTTPEANLHVVGNVYASGNLEVGTTNLFVDTLTGRVGLGTNLPGYTLDVRGGANVNTMNAHTIQGVQRISVESLNTTTAPVQITAGSLNDGVGALRIDSNEPDIYINDTDGGHSTIIFAEDSNAYVGIGRNASNNFYMTVRDPDVISGAWRDDTMVADRLTGDISVGYKLNVAGNVAIATNDLFVDTAVSRVGVGTTVPSHTLDVRGNANAAAYYGDGGTLSNVTLQGVTTLGNTTSRIVSFTNAHTALSTDLTSNVGIKLDQLQNVVINTGELTAEQHLVYDGTNWVNEHNDNTFIKIYNDTGGDLTRGQVVYINGAHNQNLANVDLAKSDSSATMPAIGVVYATVADGGEGLAVTYGRASGVDTSLIAVGQTVYVSNTVAGGVIGTKPYDTSPHLIQNLGVCVKSASNGSVFVTGIGRANDIPNANVLTSMTGVNYVYVNTTNNDLKKIAPGTLETKVPTLQQVTTTGATTSDTVLFTNTGEWSLKASGNIYATSNITALEYYGDGTKLDGVALQTDLAANVALIEGLRTDVNSNAGLLSTARDDIIDLENTRATYLDPTFTSNITVSNVAYIDTGMVLANTHYYTYSGSMANPSSNITLQFASNVFYAKVMAQLLHGDEDLNTLVLELQGGHKNGTPTKNITKGTFNKFGNTAYPWSSNVVCTPTEVVIEPHDKAQAYDYDIKVEYTSSGIDAKLETIKEGITAVKNFAY